MPAPAAGAAPPAQPANGFDAVAASAAGLQPGGGPAAPGAAPAAAQPGPASPGIPAAAEAARSIAPQIAGALATQQGPGRVELQLDPPELGRIEIAFEIADHGLRASISAERGSTGELMRRHGDMLLQQLQDAGFADVDLRFGDGQRQPHRAEPPVRATAAPAVPAAGEVPAGLAQAQGLAPDRLDLRF